MGFASNFPFLLLRLCTLVSIYGFNLSAVYIFLLYIVYISAVSVYLVYFSTVSINLFIHLQCPYNRIFVFIYLQFLSFTLSIHPHHLTFYSVYLSTVCVYNVYIFTLCVYLLTDLKAEIKHCACAVYILSAVTTHSICKAGSSPPLTPLSYTGTQYCGIFLFIGS